MNLSFELHSYMKSKAKSMALASAVKIEEPSGTRKTRSKEVPPVCRGWIPVRDDLDLINHIPSSTPLVVCTNHFSGFRLQLFSKNP